MLKKFVSSLMAVMLLVGCGGSSAEEPVQEPAAEKADVAAIAADIVKDLELGDLVTEAKTRIVYGSFFNAREGDEDCPVTDASAYLPNEKNSDSVGVFSVSDNEAAMAMLNDYLSAQKALSEMYSPEEVFKITNAIVESSDDGSLIIMVVCNDIEAAKKKVAAVLSKY